MGQQEYFSKPKIAAIVPAYNEAARIPLVLKTLISYPGFHEVIVVDDGSTDATADAAAAYGVRVIRNEKNIGKGQAMDTGVQASSADVLFFCDADIRGLTHIIIDDIVRPVVNGEVDMYIGMRNRKIYYARFVLLFIPLLGGERALTRKLWNDIPQRYKEKFKIETALNFYASNSGKGFRYNVFRGLTQTIKEKKYGIWRGMVWRIKMYGEIIITNIALHMQLDRLRSKE